MAMSTLSVLPAEKGRAHTGVTLPKSIIRTDFRLRFPRRKERLMSVVPDAFLSFQVSTSEREEEVNIRVAMQHFLQWHERA